MQFGSAFAVMPDTPHPSSFQPPTWKVIKAYEIFGPSHIVPPMQVSDSRMSNLEPLRREASQHGLGHLWNHFESKLPDLFVNDTNSSRVGVVVAEATVQWVSTSEELSGAIEEGVSTLFILNRYNSWSKIDITCETFSTLYDRARITPFFLHFVIGMGDKSSSKDEDFIACYSTFLTEVNCRASSAEADSGSHWGNDPSAVHHSFLPTAKHSAWVVIQPPQGFEPTVRSTTHPMYLHIRYLQEAIANWREYLEYFSETFRRLNEPLAFPNPYSKFKIDFLHEQRLHILRGKIHHAQTILINTKNTFSIIAEHERSVAQQQSLSTASHENFQRELRNISGEVDTYIATTHKLLCTAHDLKSMYSNILTFHGQELQHDTSLKLAYLTQDDVAGNKDMAVLADLMYKDSRSMRIATAIAMFYLPVNLVLTFFSTTLVWYGTAVELAEKEIPRIQVRSEVWIATIAAVVLAIGTVCWSWWWNWTGQRKLGKNSTQKISHP
ncbi:hypothetical protein F5Y14DRAFT_460409 [Nemania sp. NC0429]|nr:hypothetical protein F5Y14DRAFT_460409 [Nemania sp. NC0429]